MLVLRRLVAIAIFVGALVLGWHLAAANSQTVRIDYLFGQSQELRVWIVLLCAFAAGAIASGALLLYQVAKLSLVARRQRRILSRLEAEIHELRNLPLRSEPLAAHADDRPLAPPTGETVGPVP